MSDDKSRWMAMDGHVPLQKGWIPNVQGGYKPTTSTLTPSPPPPTGGSGVKSPDKK